MIVHCTLCIIQNTVVVNYSTCWRCHALNYSIILFHQDLQNVCRYFLVSTKHQESVFRVIEILSDNRNPKVFYCHKNIQIFYRNRDNSIQDYQIANSHLIKIVHSWTQKTIFHAETTSHFISTLLCFMTFDMTFLFLTKGQYIDARQLHAFICQYQTSDSGRLLTNNLGSYLSASATSQLQAISDARQL